MLQNSIRRFSTTSQFTQTKVARVYKPKKPLNFVPVIFQGNLAKIYNNNSCKQTDALAYFKMGHLALFCFASYSFIQNQRRKRYARACLIWLPLVITLTALLPAVWMKYALVKDIYLNKNGNKIYIVGKNLVDCTTANINEV